MFQILFLLFDLWFFSAAWREVELQWLLPSDGFEPLRRSSERSGCLNRRRDEICEGER